MPYNPYNYIKDYSYIERAGQHLSTAIKSSGEFATAMADLKKKNVSNEDQHRKAQELADELGKATKSTYVVPVPKKREDPAAYQERIVDEFWVRVIPEAELKTDFTTLKKVLTGAKLSDKELGKTTLESSRQRGVSELSQQAMLGPRTEQQVDIGGRQGVEIGMGEAPKTKEELMASMQSRPQASTLAVTPTETKAQAEVSGLPSGADILAAQKEQRLAKAEERKKSDDSLEMAKFQFSITKDMRARAKAAGEIVSKLEEQVEDMQLENELVPNTYSKFEIEKTKAEAAEYNKTMKQLLKKAQIVVKEPKVKEESVETKVRGGGF